MMDDCLHSYFDEGFGNETFINVKNKSDKNITTTNNKGIFMITIISENIIEEQKQQEFITIVKQMIEKSRKEDGCISYTLHQNTQKPLYYCIIEQWENEQAISQHNNTEHFKTLVPQMKKCRIEQKQANHFRIMDI